MTRTALTPGIFLAASTSTDLTAALACGLESITPKSIPSGRMSEGYLARPEALARPSIRVMLVPIRRVDSGQLAMGQAPFIDLAAARAASNTPMYVPHRQMLPSSPRLTSSSVGVRPGFLSRKALHAVTKPGVQ